MPEENKKPIRLRLEGSGDVGGTRIVDVDTGKVLLCKTVELRMGVKRIPSVVVELVDVDIDLRSIHHEGGGPDAH